MEIGSFEGLSCGIDNEKLEDVAPGEVPGLESVTEVGCSDVIPGGENSVILEIYPLGHSLGPGSVTVGGSSDCRLFDGF